ncbi:carboxypeptidase-like regulatory domain-containing protein [Streptomyces sp. SM14]|uniref:carboxypeptidase-like regulatory domain-containing protein n=1 Tax=Streptomyces sp. SM14 TaxID=1736045 RepID=UPI000CD50100|nr:carboxypeptidase-like regulatory domain-containing protein [Streptomyces sp. SM14]
MTESLSQGAARGVAEEAAGADTPAAEGDGRVEAGAAALVIRGTVRDSLGVALPRALVTLTVSGVGGRQLSKTRSAEDGAFEVTAPSCGDYLLSASSPQLGEESVLVRLDGRPVEVEFRIMVPGVG